MRLLWSRIKKMKRSEKGQSLAEFAVVSVPLLLLLLGMIEFGWLFNGQITITAAARESARAAAVNESAWDAADRHLARSGVILTEVFLIPGGGLEEDEEAWITARVTGQIEPLVGLFFTKTVNLTAQATMRPE